MSCFFHQLFGGRGDLLGQLPTNGVNSQLGFLSRGNFGLGLDLLSLGFGFLDNGLTHGFTLSLGVGDDLGLFSLEICDTRLNFKQALLRIVLTLVEIGQVRLDLLGATGQHVTQTLAGEFVHQEGRQCRS